MGLVSERWGEIVSDSAGCRVGTVGGCASQLLSSPTPHLFSAFDFLPYRPSSPPPRPSFTCAGSSRRQQLASPQPLLQSKFAISLTHIGPSHSALHMCCRSRCLVLGYRDDHIPRVTESGFTSAWGRQSLEICHGSIRRILSGACNSFVRKLLACGSYYGAYYCS